jgi:hypothetical protein
MRVSVVVVSALAVGLAVAIVWYFAPSGQTSEESTPVVPSGAAETTADVPKPTAESAPDLTRSAPVAPATLPGYTPQTREQMPRSAEEGERVFSAESADATWAPGAEANILGRFSRVKGLALNALQVECRTTMRKLQVAAPKSSSGGGPDIFDFFNNSLGIQPRWVRISVDAAGMMQWIAYVGRESVPNATDAISAPR